MNRKIQEIKQQEILVSELLELEKDSFIKNLFFAIFCKMYEQGYYEISLKSDDIVIYAPKLQRLFRRLNLSDHIFVKTPVSETYDEFKKFLITQTYGMNIGYLNESYNKIVLRLNNYLTNKTLNKNEKISSIVEECYLIMTEQLDNDEDYVNTEKYNHQKIKI